MKSIKKTYTQLLNLTQLFLLREHALGEMRTIDPATLEFFLKQTARPKVTPPSTKESRQPPALEEYAPPLAAAKMQPAAPTHPPTNLTPAKTLHPLPPSFSSRQEKPADAPKSAAEKPTEPPPLPSIPAVAPTAKDKPAKGKSFVLDPLPKAAPLDQTAWWKLCKNLFNNWPLKQTIPCDESAKKQGQAWLRTKEASPVTLIAFDENEANLTLLKNIAQAISLRLAPAQVIMASRIDKEDGWEALLHSPQLRLVIASDYGLYQYPKLMRFHRESPQQSRHFLHQTPLLLLSDLSFYLKEPQLKPLLWRAICNEFASLPSIAVVDKV